MLTEELHQEAIDSVDKQFDQICRMSHMKIIMLEKSILDKIKSIEKSSVDLELLFKLCIRFIYIFHKFIRPNLREIEKLLPGNPNIFPIEDVFQIAETTKYRLSQDKKYEQIEDNKTYAFKSSFPEVENHNIYISKNLFEKFEKTTRENTVLSIESCGILLSEKYQNNSSLISTIYIPKQTGEENTCEVTGQGEVGLVDFLLKNSYLKVAGWIHTHPSQDCFLSSIDLHTSFGYESMDSRAISVVLSRYSPKSSNPEIGIFRLSRTGFNDVNHCVERGFHYHSEGSFEIVSTCVFEDIHGKIFDGR